MDAAADDDDVGGASVMPQRSTALRSALGLIGSEASSPA